jgi:hypothetical protein
MIAFTQGDLMDVLETFEIESCESPIPSAIQKRAIIALEQGKVVYFPNMSFKMNGDEMGFLSPDKVDPKSKNISYDLRSDHLGGTLCEGDEALKLKGLIRRYALHCRQLMEQFFPRYVPHMTQARTSFRPVEVAGRVSSYRKDDTLLHVDSFPANPVKGRRIMRIFANVNPVGKPRVWRIGESFPTVVEKMAPRVKRPFPGLATFLQLLKITKDYRTLYDHYMLQIHDQMKGDAHYQKNVAFQEVLFPPGSTWIVYTDQVSHAAMAGQHVFEQTFNLPPTAMQDEGTTPLKVLENYFKTKLI